MEKIYKGIPFYIHIEDENKVPLGAITAALYHRGTQEVYPATIELDDESHIVHAMWTAEQTDQMSLGRYSIDIIEDNDIMLYQSNEFAKAVVSSLDFE